MRKSEQTRLEILKKSFDLIYINGYQSTSIDDIISSLKVTKGAFFYHFRNKEEMALALLNEFTTPDMKRILMDPLEKSMNPIKDLYEMLSDILMDNIHFDVRYGCPMVNLIEEMSPLNPAFNSSLKQIVLSWVNAIESCLERGQGIGAVNRHINVNEVAMYIVTGYSGARNMGKIFGVDSYHTFLKQFKIYLSSLS